jgi:hypothetical protein
VAEERKPDTETRVLRMPAEVCAELGHIKSPEPHLKYDATYCKACRQWLEPVCEWPSCSFCIRRPTLAPKEPWET